MSEATGTSAGRLYVDVEARVAGFRRDLKAKVDAEASGVKARIKAELDAKTLGKQTRDAARAASAVAVIKARMEIDRNHLREQIKTAVREATTGQRAVQVPLGVKINRAELRREISDAIREIGPVSVNVDGDTSKLKEKIARAKAEAKASDVSVPITGTGTPAPSTSGAGSSFFRGDAGTGAVASGMARVASESGKALVTLSKIPLIVSGVYSLVGAVVDLVGGLTALASVAGSAAGGLAAIPAAISAGVQGVGTLLAGFGGLGETMKALDAAEKAAASSAGSTAAATRQIEAAQRSLANAQEALSLARLRGQEKIGDSEERLADIRAQSAERVQSAEERWAVSQSRSKAAQEALTRAREQAREKLEDLALSLRGAALDEEGARLAIARATENQLKTIRSPESSALDKREADLAVKQAVQRLDEIKLANERLKKSGAEQQAAGIEGSADVVNAKNEIIEAAGDEQKAEYELAKVRAEGARDTARAERDLSRTRRDVAIEIADAAKRVRQEQADLKAAYAATGGAASAAGQAQAEAAAAMAALTPAGRSMVRYLRDELLPEMKTLRATAQEGLLPGVEDGLRRLAGTFLPKVNGLLAETSVTIGRVARNGAESMATGPWSRQFADIVASNNVVIERGGAGMFNLLNAAGSLAHGAGPFMEDVAEAFERGTRALADFLERQDEIGSRDPSKGIQGFLSRSEESAGKLWRLLKNVAAILRDVGHAAMPSGQTLLDNLLENTEKLRDIVASPQGQASLAGWFQKAEEPTRQVGKLITNVFQTLTRIGETTGGGALDAFFDALNMILDVIDALRSIPGGGETISWIFKLAGYGLALGLVAKGVGGILSNVQKLAKVTGLGKIVDQLKQISGLNAKGGGLQVDVPSKKTTSGGKTTTGGAGETLSRGVQRVTWGPAALPVRVIGGLGGTGGLDTSADKTAKGQSKPKAGGKAGAVAAAAGAGAGTLAAGEKLAASSAGKGLLSKAGGLGGKVLKGGGAAGIAGGLLAALFGDQISNGAGGLRDFFGGALGGAGTGAGLGATIGSVVPGLGTGIGAAVGGVGGALYGGLSNSKYGKQIIDANKQALDSIVKGLPQFASTVKEKLGGLLSDDKPWMGLIRGATGAFESVKKGLPAQLSAWKTQFGQGLGAIEDRLSGFKDAAIAKAGQAWTGLMNGVNDAKSGLAAVKSNIGEKLSAAGDFFSGLKTTAGTRMSETWSNLKTQVSTSLGGAKDSVLSRISDVTGRFSTSFSNARDNIGKAWAGVQQKASGPVSWIGTNVYNSGIRKVWNFVAGLVGAKELPAWSAPVKNFATGGTHGVFPGHAPGIDSITARVSPGEALMVPQFTQAVGGPGAIAALNEAAMRLYGRAGAQLTSGRRADRFAFGGIAGKIKSMGSALGGAVLATPGKLADFARSMGQAVSGGLSDVISGTLTSLLSRVTSTLTGTPYAAGLGGLASTAIGGIADKISGQGSKLAVNPDVSGLPASVTRWTSLVVQVLQELHRPLSEAAAVLRRINFESSGNETAINLTDSNAKAGHPSQGLMQTIPSTFAAYAGPYVRRGITDPLANIYAGVNYAIHRYGSVAAIDPLTRPRGYSEGGIVRGRRSRFDRLLIAARPDEGILTPEAVDAIGGPSAVFALNSGAQGLYAAGQGARRGVASAPAAAASGAGPLIGSLALHTQASRGDDVVDALLFRLRTLRHGGVYRNSGGVFSAAS